MSDIFKTYKIRGDSVVDSDKLIARVSGGKLILNLSQLTAANAFVDSPQIIGKWLDGRDVKRVVIEMENTTEVSDSTYTSLPEDTPTYDKVLHCTLVGDEEVTCAHVYDGGVKSCNGSIDTDYIVLEYVEPIVEE